MHGCTYGVSSLKRTNPRASSLGTLQNIGLRPVQGNSPSTIPSRRAAGRPTIHHLVRQLTLPRKCVRKLWVLLLGPLVGTFRSRIRTFQTWLQTLTSIGLSHKFHPKQTPIRRSNSLVPNMTYNERLRGYLSNALDVLGRLKSKLHENSYKNIKHHFNTYYSHLIQI